jgi:hypothetical protein
VTTRDRDRLAAPVIAIYCLLVATGLALYGLTVPSAPLVPLVVGVIAGTATGHVLGLANVRTWIVVVVVIAVLYLGALLQLPYHDVKLFWLAVVPSIACAYASLAERWSLAAMWFPAVLWMLTVLDRTRGVRSLDVLGIVLLAVLAFIFVVFLLTRESRRAAIWRTAGAVRLARATRVRIGREAPARLISRATWPLALTASMFALTTWVAPRLWKSEQTTQHHAIVGAGVPCCPASDETERTRVREYMDLGRGSESDHDLWNECRACDALPVSGPACGVDGSYVDVDHLVAPSRGDRQRYGVAEPSAWHAPPSHKPTTPQVSPTSASNIGARDAVMDFDEEANRTHTPAPAVIPDPTPARPASPAPLAPLAPAPVTPRGAPTAPTAPHVARDAPSPTAASAHDSMVSNIAPRDHRDDGHTLLGWLVTLFAGALGLQALLLAVRPLRRAVTLRHLRQPYWDETVDQRVSNSWQLALIGLRDAGWRCDSSEAPREFAHRVGISELERCATILERARYGVGLADNDLADMADGAKTVYHRARRTVGLAARTIAWLRWPLA